MSTSIVAVVAVRQLDRATRASVAARLPAVLAGLLLVEPDAELRIRVGSAARSGRGTIAVSVRADSATALAAELAFELDAAFSVTVRDEEPDAAPRIVLVAAPTLGTGFAAPVTPAREVTVHASETLAATVADGLTAWLALAAEYPGLDLELVVRRDDEHRSEPSFVIAPTVGFDGTALPFRARAILRDLFPGLSVSNDASNDASNDVASDESTVAASLRADAAGARTYLQVPLPGRTELVGMAIAHARPVPMLPTASADDESGIRVGAALLGSGRRVDVRLTAEELPRHQHVLGQTGSGKSSLLAAMAHGYASDGAGCLVVDPHGTLIARIMSELPQSARERVWLIEAGDLENPVPINPLAVDDPVQLQIVIQDMILIFYKLFDTQQQGIVGPRFEAFLTNALRGLRDLRGSRASLLDVPRVYRDRAAERAVARAVTDPQLVDFWRREMPELSASSRSEVVGWFTSKFDRFANTAAMRGILGSGADAFDPALAMDEGRIILLDLSKARLGEVASNLLGFLYLTRFWSSIPARTSTRPFGIIVDEAQSFSAGSLPAMLSEGRKWGASVTVAHQYLAQLEGELGDALAGNVATTVAFRSGTADAAALATRMGGSISAEALTMQPDLQALLLRTSGSAIARPHSLLVDHGERVTARTGAAQPRFAAEVRAQTHRDLVDPHRGLGVYEPLVERPPAPRAARADAPPSFLDEWLEKRAREQSATDEVAG